MTTHQQDPAAIGPFTIQARLGRGAMGAVYLARSPGGRSVAVKVVRDELAGDSAFRARFAREIDAARRVSGAFTAAVIDADPAAEPPWLATEYLPGPTLQKAIETSGPLPAEAVRTLAGGLAEALAAIHAGGLVHRDLKPSNIVLSDNGPRVIDFGIARALEEASLTATGMVIGTPGYLSPEQITGGSVGPASDVFALGAVLVFAASGRGPFASGSPASLLHRVVNEPPYLPSLPDPLHDVVRRCLAPDPARRPTPAEILSSLGPAVDPATRVLPAPTNLDHQPGAEAGVEPAGIGGMPRDAGAQPDPRASGMPPGAGTGMPVGQPFGPEAASGRPVPGPGGTVFVTRRGRSALWGVVLSVLGLGFLPQEPQFRATNPGAAGLGAVVALVFFWFALRHWWLVVRPKVTLRLAGDGVTVQRAGSQGTVPWNRVSRLRISGTSKRPWLIAWVEPPYQNLLPVRRKHHGGLRVYPIAHSASQRRRQLQIDELHAALNWYAAASYDKSY